MKCMRNRKKLKKLNMKRCNKKLRICIKTILMPKRTLKSGRDKGFQHLIRMFMMSS